MTMKYNNMNKDMRKWGIVMVLAVITAVNTVAQNYNLQSDYLNQMNIGFYKVEVEDPQPYIPMEPSKLMDFQPTVSSASWTSVLSDYLNGGSTGTNTSSGTVRRASAAVRNVGGGGGVNAAGAATSLLNSVMATSSSGDGGVSVMATRPTPGGGGGFAPHPDGDDDEQTDIPCPLGEGLWTLIFLAGAYTLKLLRKRKNND